MSSFWKRVKCKLFFCCRSKCSINSELDSDKKLYKVMG